MHSGGGAKEEFYFQRILYKDRQTDRNFHPTSVLNRCNLSHMGNKSFKIKKKQVKVKEKWIC